MRTYGVLLRVYTASADEVPGRVSRAIEHLTDLYRSRLTTGPKRVIVLVPADYDCGQTGEALRSRVHETGAPRDFASVIEPKGYHSLDVLNAGVRQLREEGVTHGIILSGKAMPYARPRAFAAIDDACEKGALVAGLALPELADIVRAGRIQNTFACWNIDALTTVGAFDSALDVEEIAPIIRIGRRYGACIAPIEVGEGQLDVHASTEARERHRQVMDEKIARQHKECERLDADFAFIRSLLLPGKYSI